MGREIKFRAWDKWKNQMIQPNDGDFIGWHAMSNWKDCLEIMQYTGIKDSQGVEIYEGDIVRRIQKDIERNVMDDFTAPVEWNKYATRFAVSPPECDDISCCRDLHFFGYGSIEVVGNIHENPELAI